MKIKLASYRLFKIKVYRRFILIESKKHKRLQRVRAARSNIDKYWCSFMNRWDVNNTNEVLKILNIKDTLGGALFVRDILTRDSMTDEQCALELTLQ